jgi:hypothetical protein
MISQNLFVLCNFFIFNITCVENNDSNCKNASEIFQKQKTINKPVFLLEKHKSSSHEKRMAQVKRTRQNMYKNMKNYQEYIHETIGKASKILNEEPLDAIDNNEKNKLIKYFITVNDLSEKLLTWKTSNINFPQPVQLEGELSSVYEDEIDILKILLAGMLEVSKLLFKINLIEKKKKSTKSIYAIKVHSSIIFKYIMAELHEYLHFACEYNFDIANKRECDRIIKEHFSQTSPFKLEETKNNNIQI